MSYKRNQVEEAVARTFNPDCKKPSSELRTRIKRLLELDRSIGRKPRSKNAEEANFGFFSKEAPGTGADISYSEYEAFALLNGLRLMEHGWPQGFAVSIMRRIRVDLEAEHEWILALPPDELFDQDKIRTSAHAGDLAVDNTHPVFLILASTTKPAPNDDAGSPLVAVRRGELEATKFWRNAGATGATMFELSGPAHDLHENLMKVEPRPRGRG
jgi:hypothetical protein